MRGGGGSCLIETFVMCGIVCNVRRQAGTALGTFARHNKQYQRWRAGEKRYNRVSKYLPDTTSNIGGEHDNIHVFVNI